MIEVIGFILSCAIGWLFVPLTQYFCAKSCVGLEELKRVIVQRILFIAIFAALGYFIYQLGLFNEISLGFCSGYLLNVFCDTLGLIRYPKYKELSDKLTLRRFLKRE